MLLVVMMACDASIARTRRDGRQLTRTNARRPRRTDARPLWYVQHIRLDNSSKISRPVFIDALDDVTRRLHRRRQLAVSIIASPSPIDGEILMPLKWILYPQETTCCELQMLLNYFNDKKNKILIADKLYTDKRILESFIHTAVCRLIAEQFTFY